MIDCNITTNYLTERDRMTQKGKLCEMCYGDQCPLCDKNNGIGIACVELEPSFPEKAIAIVQKWSNAHPQRTYLTELLEKFPNIVLHDDGTPKYLCPYQLGMTNSKNCNNDCSRCWSQSVEGGSEVHD